MLWLTLSPLPQCPLFLGETLVLPLIYSCSCYDAKKHPKFNSGKWTEKQVLEEFLKSFEAPETTDGIVRKLVLSLLF